MLVTLVAAGVGFVLAGGQLPGRDAAPAPDAVTRATEPPTSSAPVAVQKPAQATAAPPTVAPTATQATAAPQATAPPTPAPPTAVPPATSGVVSVPPSDAPPSADGEVSSRDARLTRIEGRISDYFSALSARDFARAQQVCCTEAWQLRYPLEEWVHNFDGVTDLKQTGKPRYVQVDPDVIVVDTDYSFVSAGVPRTLTLRWTFKEADGEWKADLAEATARG